MAVRRVYLWPDPILEKVAEPVTEFNDELKALAEDLFDTMYEAYGVGLSGNQIGVLKRIITIDIDPKGVSKKDPEFAKELDEWGFTGPITAVNPRILEKKGDIIWREGCISVPGVQEQVNRFAEITLEAEDVEGKTFQLEARGLLSVAIQHEIDHLDGKVFVDYLSKVKRAVAKRKMRKWALNDVDDGVAAAVQLYAP